MHYNEKYSNIIKHKIINDGYAIIDFCHLEYLHKIQEIIQDALVINPVELHQDSLEDGVRISKIKNAKDQIVKNNYVSKLFLENLNLFDFLFAPDIDIQSNIHLRISRPNEESDLVDWHRDTFYGNPLWEINFWFPVFPLEKEAGLSIVQNTHTSISKNVHLVKEQNAFRKKVVKGSVENELGFVYAPKSDDAMDHLDLSKIQLLSPKVGECIIFLGHMIHRAHNRSSKTRITIDIRLKNMFAPTNTKPDYYQPLTRGCIAQYVENMQKQEVLSGN